MAEFLCEIPLRGRTLPHRAVVATPELRKGVGPAPAEEGIALPSFVAGPENRLVAGAINRLIDAAAATTPDDKNGRHSRNTIPLLAFFGAAGTGKTHLARGLVEHWQTQCGEQSAVYATASDFRRDFLNALDSNEVAEFRGQFRGRQLLAIDSLHHLPPDEHLLQELRYTLDSYDNEGGCIVVTSDRPARFLPQFPPDLRSRLASGLSLQLAPPGPAASACIVRQLAAALGRPLSEEAAYKLTLDLPTSANKLFGAIFKLCSQALAADGAKTQLNRVPAGGPTRQPSLKEIIAVVAKYMGVSIKQLKSSSRKQSIVFARAIGVFLLRELRNMSYEEIGRALGGRDHTTIIHSYRKIDRERARDLATREILDDLVRILAKQ